MGHLVVNQLLFGCQALHLTSLYLRHFIIFSQLHNFVTSLFR